MNKLYAIFGALIIMWMLFIQFTQPIKEVVHSTPTYEEQCEAIVKVVNGQGMGTGFFINKDGKVITAYHVIEDPVNLTIVTRDGTKYKVKIIKTVKEIDLAILQILTDKDVPFLTFAKAEEPVGADTYIIGHPYGQDYTYTRGYISSNTREGIYDLQILSTIQTDAPSNPGNSGGPIFNMKGKVLGIVSYGMRGSDGLGFGVSCEYINKWVK